MYEFTSSFLCTGCFGNICWRLVLELYWKAPRIEAALRVRKCHCSALKNTSLIPRFTCGHGLESWRWLLCMAWNWPSKWCFKWWSDRFFHSGSEIFDLLGLESQLFLWDLNSGFFGVLWGSDISQPLFLPFWRFGSSSSWKPFKLTIPWFKR